MPVVAALILFGVFFAASSRSLSVLYGLSALTQTTPGIEHLVDDRNERVGVEDRLALRDRGSRC